MYEPPDPLWEGAHSRAQTVTAKEDLVMRHGTILKAAVVLGMGIATFLTPHRAAARQLCYTCWRADVCSEIEGQALCEGLGGDLCPNLRTCEWPASQCASNEVFYTCQSGP